MFDNLAEYSSWHSKPYCLPTLNNYYYCRQPLNNLMRDSSVMAPCSGGPGACVSSDVRLEPWGAKGERWRAILTAGLQQAISGKWQLRRCSLEIPRFLTSFFSLIHPQLLCVKRVREVRGHDSIDNIWRGYCLTIHHRLGQMRTMRISYYRH